MRDGPSDFPDKTLSELQEEEHDIVEEIHDDVEEEMVDRRKSISLIAATNVLAQMLADDVITFREYVRLSDWIEEKNAELERGVL